MNADIDDPNQLTLQRINQFAMLIAISPMISLLNQTPDTRHRTLDIWLLFVFGLNFDTDQCFFFELSFNEVVLVHCLFVCLFDCLIVCLHIQITIVTTALLADPKNFLRLEFFF